MSSYERARELAEKLRAEGIPATVDPRSATPPVVLIPPPERTYDLACGYSARWQLWALVPGTANADAHKALDELADAVARVLAVERMSLGSYVLGGGGGEPLPAYRIEYEEGI